MLYRPASRELTRRFVQVSAILLDMDVAECIASNRFEGRSSTIEFINALSVVSSSAFRCISPTESNIILSIIKEHRLNSALRCTLEYEVSDSSLSGGSD